MSDPADRVLKLNRWILNQKNHLNEFEKFFDSFVKFLNSFDLRIIRASLGVRTSHPQVEALSFAWSDFEHFHEPVNAPALNMRFFNLGDAIIVENKIAPGGTSTSQFSNSPIPRVAIEKQTYSYRFTGKETTFEYPILKDLVPFSPTEYLALPLHYNENNTGFSSFVSKKAGGLSAEDVTFIELALGFFALKFESYLHNYVTDSLLRLYLGQHAGAKVKNGKVQLGNVDTIESVIWFSDIRSFTRMMTQNDPRLMVSLMNGYFEGIIETIQKYNGEVLKFIGDGLLAVFTPDHKGKAKQIKYKALLCARDASRFLKKLNNQREKENLPQFSHGIGLHYGSVEYGNIGASSRLDFTVIGEAVNTASRIANLCGKLNSEVLISGELANQLKLQFEAMGSHPLKGIDTPQELFRLPYA